MSSPAALLCAFGASVWQYYGPLFLGTLSATFLSGMTTVQTIVYVKLYHNDTKYLKALVFVVWALDIMQTGLSWNVLWYYLVRNFGDFTKSDDIPISLTIAAFWGWVTIMLVQSCYLYRIFCLSNRNFRIATPIAILMIIRFTWTFGCGIEMFRLKKFSLYLTQYKWLVTLGLSFETIVDVTITSTLAFLLMIQNRGFLRVGNQVMVLTNLNSILDSLILYTLEIGSVTGIMSILSLFCWLQLDNHMVFIGLHAIFGKVHGSCLMAMLNMRYSLRQKPMTHEGGTEDWRPHPQPISSLSSPDQLETVHVDVSNKSTQRGNGSQEEYTL